MKSMNIRKTAGKLKRALFPSRQEAMVARWWADGGDDELRYNYDLDERSLVLDLGGYKGQWTSDLFARYRCRVIVFEPARDFARKIERRFRKNDRIEVLQYGLAASSRTETLHIDASASSIYGKASDLEQIRLVDVESWIRERKLDKIDLVKINIEGGEYELLEKLIETGLIGIFENVQVQFHDVAPDSHSRMERIQKALGKTHTPTYQYEFVWENWTRRR